MTFRIQAGGIYKLPFPFTDLSGKKTRLMAAEIPRFAALEHAPRPFEPGVTPIPLSRKVLDAAELQLMVGDAGWAG